MSPGARITTCILGEWVNGETFMLTYDDEADARLVWRAFTVHNGRLLAYAELVSANGGNLGMPLDTYPTTANLLSPAGMGRRPTLYPISTLDPRLLAASRLVRVPVQVGDYARWVRLALTRLDIAEADFAAAVGAPLDLLVGEVESYEPDRIGPLLQRAIRVSAALDLSLATTAARAGLWLAAPASGAPWPVQVRTARQQGQQRLLASLTVLQERFLEVGCAESADTIWTVVAGTTP